MILRVSSLIAASVACWLLPAALASGQDQVLGKSDAKPHDTRSPDRSESAGSRSTSPGSSPAIEKKETSVARQETSQSPWTTEEILGDESAPHQPSGVAAEEVLPLFEDVPELASGDACGDVSGRCLMPCKVNFLVWSVFGEYLYLRPGGDKISYAAPIDGAIVPPDGVGPITISPDAIVDSDFSSGFRAGGEFGVNPKATVGLSYSQLESSDTSGISVDAPFVLRSLVSHPGTESASTDYLGGSARADVRNRIGDVYLSREFFCNCTCTASWFVGLRYASLEQEFDSTLTSSTRVETVGTDVDFSGGGFRVGLAAERLLGADGGVSRRCRGGCGSGFRVYGRTHASFLAGKFQTSYQQSDNFTPEPLVIGGWEDERVVPILDIELGVSWISPKERWRLAAGYLFSAWYNVVTTEPFINGVRTNYSGDISETLTFDGLTATAEFRF